MLSEREAYSFQSSTASLRMSESSGIVRGVHSALRVSLLHVSQ